LVDDHNRYMWLFLLRSKDEAAAEIRRFQADAEQESRCPLRVLRTDRGGEFTAAEFAGWCAEQGINWGELDGNTSPLTVESWTLSQPPAAAVKSFREEADVAPASPTGL
jgi:hypothetical protein